MLEGKEGVSNDSIFAEKDELVGRVQGDVTRGGEWFLGPVIAGGVGVTVRDRSVSIAAAAYWDSETVDGQFAGVKVDALGTFGRA